MEAVDQGYYEICQLLLENGANPNLTTHGDQTALIMAASEQSFELCKLLVDHGASVDHAASNGLTPLLCAIRSDSEDSYEKVQLFVENGASVNQRIKHGNTPLIEAAEAKNTKTVRYLLQQGANVHRHDEFGNTALHRAVEGTPCPSELLELLLDYGADINVENKDEINPLMMACSSGNRVNALLLANSGANFQNRSGLDSAWNHCPDHVKYHLIRNGYKYY